MLRQTDAILQRFHRALVREIRETRPQYLRQPFSVSEIYEHLVPYRTHRDVIGAGMSAEYEYALLRLLSGEGGYLRLESEAAKEAIRRELESSNPNTTVYREFAAAPVRLEPGRLGEAALEVPFAEPAALAAAPDGEAGGADPSRRVAGTGAPGLPDAPGAAWEPAAAARPVGAPEEGGGAMGLFADAGAAALPERCWACDGTLPQRATLRFCPRCGVNVRIVPCPECGEELELGWRYCITCGRDMAQPSSP